jgi:hypothetical protein
MVIACALVYSTCKQNESVVKPNPATVHNKSTDWVSGSAVINGTYEITNIATGSNAYAINFALNGTNPPLAVENTYNALNTDQDFKLISLGSGYFEMLNIDNGLALTALNAANGWQLQYNAYTGTVEQQWDVVYQAATGTTSAGYQIVSKANTALCATASTTASNSKIVNGTILTTSANSQRWNFAMVAYLDSTVTNFFKRTSGSEAFDGDFSTPLQSGNVMWFTNDVFYNQLSGGELPCLFNYHNSIMIQPTATNWAQASTSNWVASSDPNVPNGSPQLFWEANTARYVWPGAGIQIGNSVYAYCNIIQNSGSSFSVVSDSLADINISTHEVSYKTLPALNGINFGIGMIKNANYVYVYGYVNESLGANVYVARFDTTAVTTWTFWNGSSWSSSATSAVSIGQAASAGADIAQIDGKYVMISTAFNTNTGKCDTVTSIFSSFSTSLTGPFSSLKVIYNITDRKSGYTPYYYTPVIQPQATVSGSNEFLFTYCINQYAPCLTTCVNSQTDPNGYRPRGVRVPYSVVDPSL